MGPINIFLRILANIIHSTKFELKANFHFTYLHIIKQISRETGV